MQNVVVHTINTGGVGALAGADDASRAPVVLARAAGASQRSRCIQHHINLFRAQQVGRLRIALTANAVAVDGRRSTASNAVNGVVFEQMSC